MGSLTWNGNSGNWNDPANWTVISGTDTVPEAGDDVSIDAPGAYTVTITDPESVHNVTLNNFSTTLDIAGDLTLGGTLSDQSGALVLPSGTLQGGNVDVAGGSITLDGGTLLRTTVAAAGGAGINSGTLYGVTWLGTLAVVGEVDVQGGLTLEASDGDKPGALDLTQGQLNFLDSETLDNANVNYIGVIAPSVTPFSVVAGSTLTLGKNLVMSSDGLSQGSIDGPGVIVNEGTLNTPQLPGSMLISGDFVNDGSMTVGYSLEIAGDLVNNGMIGPLGFFTTLVADQDLIGDGTVALQNFHALPAGNLTVDGAIEGNQVIQGPFGGAFTVVAGSIDATVTITNFSAGSTIDLTNAPFEGTLTTVSYVDGLLTLKDGGTVEDLFEVPGLPNTAVFSTRSDGGGTPGTDIFTTEAAVACFVSGTRIRTEHGEVAVEDLRIGDRVPVVRAGGTLPIIWIGHRHLRIAGHPRPRDMYPVRVSAGAFADFVPMRDLWLSPEHAVFLHGVLVPVGLLVNGSSIAQVPCAEVTYWHVELASHDLMLCEGAWTESFLDMGNRSAFEEQDGPVQLHPDFSPGSWQARACQQQERGGPVVDAIRRAIDARVVPRAEAA